MKCNLFNLIRKIRIKNLELEVKVSPWNIYPILSFLNKNTHTQFQSLLDIVVYDIPKNKERFVIIYSLLSKRFNRRVFIKTKTNEISPLLSISSIYRTGNWLEREIWDLFGIFFILHRDLRRILTDYGFNSHPLRKDFPLMGHYETLYDETQKRIINKSIIGLNQEYRVFKLS